MPVANLDYQGAKLSIEVNNEVEQAYRVPACSKEPWTVAFIEAMPAGAVFWDIGANVGPYTLIAASRGLYVVAVEPAPFNFGTLFRNLGMNNLVERCLMLCCALGEKTGVEYMHYQDTRSGAASHVLGGARKQFFHKQLVLIRTIDDLVTRILLPGDQPHYMKIDVEGWELSVLKGAREFLENDRLAGLMIEMQLDTEAETTAFLNERQWVIAQRWEVRGTCYGRFERKAE